MSRKIMIILLSVVFLIFPSPSNHSQSQGINNVELYDIQKDSVTKIVPTSSLFQEAAENFLKGIDSIYVKVRPIPKTGYMVKIPLEPSVQINNKWLNDLVNEVIIIFPIDDEPFLLVFDDENHPLFFNFKGNTDLIIKALEIKQKDS
jgi:hypothetical protein